MDRFLWSEWSHNSVQAASPKCTQFQTQPRDSEEVVTCCQLPRRLLHEPGEPKTNCPWRKGTARRGAQACRAVAESLQLPVGVTGGGFTQGENTPTFHCRHSRVPAESLFPEAEPGALPLPPLTRQRAGRGATGPVELWLIFSGLLSPLTVHTQEPSGPDNHLEEPAAEPSVSERNLPLNSGEGSDSLLGRDDPEGPPEWMGWELPGWVP